MQHREDPENNFNGAAGVNPRMASGPIRSRLALHDFNGAAGVNPRMADMLQLHFLQGNYFNGAAGVNPRMVARAKGNAAFRRITSMGPRV